MKTRRMTVMEAFALLQSLDEEESDGGAGSESDVWKEVHPALRVTQKAFQRCP